MLVYFCQYLQQLELFIFRLLQLWLANYVASHEIWYGLWTVLRKFSKFGDPGLNHFCFVAFDVRRMNYLQRSATRAPDSWFEPGQYKQLLIYLIEVNIRITLSMRSRAHHVSLVHSTRETLIATYLWLFLITY